MIFKYVGRDFIGTRAEILEQIENYFSSLNIDDIHLGEESFSINKIKRILIKRIQDKVPKEIFNIKIGNVIYNGTKYKIKREFLDTAKGVDVIHKGSGQFELLGVCVYCDSYESVSEIRSQILEEVKRIINDI